MKKNNLNKTDHREVTVWRNDLYTVGLVTGCDHDVTLRSKQCAVVQKYSVYLHCAAFYSKSRHRLHRPTSAHILEPY